jgi:hypothetical protein
VAPIGVDDDDDGDAVAAILAGGGGGGGGNGPHFQDVTAPFLGEPCDCDVLDSDGILDLKLKFETEELAEELELEDLPPGGSLELVLTGELSDGTPFAASDCALIVPPKAPPGLLSVSSTAPGVFIDAGPADKQLDDGGFAPFQRMFAPGTTVTLTAPPYYQGSFLVGWNVQRIGRTAVAGGFIPGHTLTVTVWSQQLGLEAVYLKMVPE